MIIFGGIEVEVGITKTVLSEFILGDMKVRYDLIEENKQVEWSIFPKDVSPHLVDANIFRESSLVQIRLLDQDDCLVEPESQIQFKYDSQEVDYEEDEIRINTYLMDGRGHLLIHHVSYTQGESTVKTWCSFMNQSDEVATLQWLNPFDLTECTPFLMTEEEIYKTDANSKLSDDIKHVLRDKLFITPKTLIAYPSKAVNKLI